MADPYIQDTWRITPTFTANLALSWFGITSPNPVGGDKNLIHSFDFAAGVPTFAALGQTNPSVYPMIKSNIAPRIGFVYAPAVLKNTVFRAGWGLYYSTQNAVNFQYAVVSRYISVNNAVSNVQPKPVYVLGVNAMPAFTVGQITQAQANSINGPLQYLGDHQRTPTISQWNVDIQRTFAQKYSLDVAYIGNSSHHLAMFYDPFDCSEPGSNLCRDSNIPYNGKFSYMQEVDSIGAGNFNALLVKFQRQFSGGLSLHANYTYQKTLAASQAATSDQRKSCLLQCDYGPASYSVPQSFVISAVAELPFGRNRRFGRNVNPFVDELIGGWDVDAIGTMQKGFPFTIGAPNNTAWSTASIRANTYCDGRKALGESNPRKANLQWLRPQSPKNNEFSQADPNYPLSCYVDPSKDPVNLTGPGGTLPAGARAAFGTSSVNSVWGPGINNWDIGVHKSFAVYGETSFTMRGEFFNAWNHTQFANPVAGVASTNFGAITATQHDAREIQLGATLQF